MARTKAALGTLCGAGILTLLLGLTAPAVARGEDAPTYHDCVVVVLDASGSMGERLRSSERKMDAAKSALLTVLANVPASTWVGILVLPADGWVYPLGPRNDGRIRDAVRSIRHRGGTPLAEYMKMGADRLLQERGKQFGYGSYRLLVVTDGEHTGRTGLVERFTPDVVQRGLVLDVIGVGMENRHTLAQYAHSYRSAMDKASLQRAIQEVFAEVSDRDDGVAGNEIFDLLEGLEPEAAAAMIEAYADAGNHPIGEAAPGAQPTPVAASGSPKPSTGGSGGSTRPRPTPGASCNCHAAGARMAATGLVGLALLALGLVVMRRRR